MTAYKTPLERARDETVALIQRGVDPNHEHVHVGENGTRCEFCGRPLTAQRHDPLKLKRGDGW